jgi:chemotaxis protein histidine kinase CheA
VADYDKLLPGWSHFAQFTIAVVNKDPKKSKYSDTLHRFCKKEHDWGWKKFMELGKMADGFVDKDTLTIKVQVQVIKDRQTAPFRTLDSHYRRELIRVYLSNIEGIVRRFVEGKKQFVDSLLSKGLTKYWEDLKEEEKKKLSFTQAAPLLKIFNKKFFNEKEVTSTLMMDAAYCGMKVLDLHYTKKDGSLKGKDESEKPEALKAYLKNLTCNIALDSSKNIFVFQNDALEELQKFVQNPSRLYPFEDKSNDGVSSAKPDNGKEIDLPRDIAERDELKLVDLARHILEVFAISYIAEHNIEKAWTEAEVIRRQEELIREEEEATKGEAERLAAKAEAERERRARKKERQRAKKEAERAKKEALEAEKAREEAKKRAEQERKRQEAEEKRQQEEAKKEAERLKQLEQKQAATAKKSANVSKPNVNIVEVDSKKIPMPVESAHGDSESMDETSSALTSARSDHSSMRGAKSKPATLQNTPRDGGSDRDLEAEKASSQNATSESLIRMKQLLQSRDEEILVLQAKVKSLEEELERSQARIASLVSSGSAPTTPQRNANKGISPEDLASIPTHHNSSPVAKQGVQYVSGRANLSQMSVVGNPSEAILASAMTRGNLKEGMQSKQQDIGQVPQVAGVVNYSRLGSHSQNPNPARQSSLPSSTALPQGQQALNPSSQFSSISRNLPVYSKSEVPMANKGPMSYRQYQPSQLQSGSQVLPDRQNPRGDVPGTNMNLNPSRAPVMSSMNGMTKLDAGNPNTRYVQNPNGLGITGGPQNAFTQQMHTESAQQKAQISNISEASGLDDFAHLGLITDLLE